jgi:D-serine deaminase-like pyridoxal phosphate-dependent protein
MSEKPWTYESLKQAIGQRSLPLVLVDLRRFDDNIRYFSERAARAGKTIRIASKSIRVPELLHRAISIGGSAVCGLMCYSAPEASFLGSNSFDDLLVAYPTVDPSDVAAVGVAAKRGNKITLTVDCSDHVQKLLTLWNTLGFTTPLRVCVDVDVSWRPVGFHVGAQRSPVRSAEDFERLLDEILATPKLMFTGIIAYDAQLAGVTDANPFGDRRNLPMRVMKSFSATDVVKKRNQFREVLKRRGIEAEFYNGGGTGSFEHALQDPSLTEVTIGSGLLQPHLFDYYRGTHRAPAFCFALAVTRRPQVDRVTCQGGGFIASGATGRDRSPIPILPAGLRIEPLEGFGEVQTPLIIPPELQNQLAIGDPIFFRPAKAGEIAERFAQYYLMEDGKIVDQVPTYRGLDQCFH